MPATLKLTHKAIGAEVRRGTYDVVLDDGRVGSYRRRCRCRRRSLTVRAHSAIQFEHRLSAMGLGSFSND